MTKKLVVGRLFLIPEYLRNYLLAYMINLQLLEQFSHLSL